MPTPVRFSPELDQPAPDEAATIADIEEQLDLIQRTTARDNEHATRAAHAKGHAIIHGVLTVVDDLPPELAQGLFARPGRYEATVRISTNAGDLLDDAIALPRGLALKVDGVAGERMAGAADATSQDFILVNGPEFPAKDAAQFLGSLKLLARTTDKAQWAKKLFSAVAQPVERGLEAVGMDSPRLHQMGGAPSVHPLGETYYSKTAFRFGDHIAKLALFPVAPALTALTDTLIAIDGRADALREEVDRVMAAHGGRWELRVQLNVDLAAMPVDDPTVHWDEGSSGYRTVATLDAAPQRTWAPGVTDAEDDALAFNIWNGLEAHRPLGSINRARRDTYRRSSAFRHAANGCPMRL